MISTKEQDQHPLQTQLIGIDVGGTFTDFVWLANGKLHVHKVSTTPADQSQAILSGIEALGISEDARVIHGTTVATNALLERRGAKTALLTTKGFRDVLAIGRQNRPHLYRLGQEKPPVLVPSALRLEVEERIGAVGEVVQSLDEEALSRVATALQEEAVESIAIVFLFSFLNPTHERRAFEILRRKLAGVHFSISCELLPEYREYERAATTVINAYVQPLVARYFSQLRTSLGTRSIRVMQSSGGAIGLEDAAQQPARLVLSGPAGGIVGAFEVARRAMKTDAPKLLTFDMGGTSTDVALCPGVLPRTSESEISGLPLRFPSVGIHTVGAGGGSIAWIDDGGILRVGPQSAGAHPGPVCYNRGGTEATVTDANLVLGRLNAEGFLGGDTSMKLNLAKARESIGELGKRLGRSAEQAALGIIRVANATMERALRKVSVEQGHDPRDYTMVPYGGAGPLHACELADALEIERILIPRFPGVLSAMGLLMADISYDASNAVLQPFDQLLSNLHSLSQNVQQLSARVVEMLSDQGDGVPAVDAQIAMRYVGQSYELDVALSLPLDTGGLSKALERFHQLHQHRYGYQTPNAPVEVVTLRVSGTLPGAKPALPSQVLEDVDAAQAIVGKAELQLDTGEPVIATCYDREALKAGMRIAGPCIVLQYDTTLVITGLWEGVIDEYLNVSLWRTGHAPLAHT